MRLGPDDPFWVVIDPSERSELEDILFECTIRKLELAFRGGLTAAEKPTIFTERDEAERDARGRLLALRAR